MICYKDKTFCKWEDCSKHYPSKCSRVLTDYDLLFLRSNPLVISYFTDKPECYEQRKVNI